MPRNSSSTPLSPEICAPVVFSCLWWPPAKRISAGSGPRTCTLGSPSKCWRSSTESPPSARYTVKSVGSTVTAKTCSLSLPSAARLAGSYSRALLMACSAPASAPAIKVASISALDPFMYLYYAARQIVELGIDENGLVHYGFQGLLIRMHADGFGQVAITVGVVGHQLAHQGQ